MWELDHKEGWALKNWCFWTVVLEKTLESPLDGKEIKPVNPKVNSPEYSLEGLMLKLKLQILWPPDAKNWLEKDPAGKDWRQDVKGTAEDEMVGWHHWFNKHEFEQAPGVGDGQGSLACCSLWGLSQTQLSDWTELRALTLVQYCQRSSSHSWISSAFPLMSSFCSKSTSRIPHGT